jgi:hypothetical protein
MTDPTARELYLRTKLARGEFLTSEECFDALALCPDARIKETPEVLAAWKANQRNQRVEDAANAVDILLRHCSEVDKRAIIELLGSYHGLEFKPKRRSK